MTEYNRITTPYSYSSAVDIGSIIFIGLHRGFGSSFEEQLADTFKNISITLEKLHLNLTNIVKVNVWLKNIKDLPIMEKLFLNYFEHDKYPARMTSTTQFIDEDCLLMIDGVAAR